VFMFVKEGLYMLLKLKNRGHKKFFKNMH